jgi:hypothetical protein
VTGLSGIEDFGVGKLCLPKGAVVSDESLLLLLQLSKIYGGLSLFALACPLHETLSGTSEDEYALALMDIVLLILTLMPGSFMPLHDHSHLSR